MPAGTRSLGKVMVVCGCGSVSRSRGRAVSLQVASHGEELCTRNQAGPDVDPARVVFCFYQIYVAMEFSISRMKAVRQLGCLGLNKRGMPH